MCSSDLEALQEYGITLVNWDALPVADGMIAAVAHKQFLAIKPADLMRKISKHGCFFDVKAQFDAVALRAAGARVWRL